MYQIVRKARYVLRSLGLVAGGLVIAALASAAFLPFLVDAEAIRVALSKNLSAWSGGPVVISGPLRIASFANLSVEASGVDFKSAPKEGPIRSARAEFVTAVLRISSLLRGKLDFRKFIVASPRVVLRRGFPEAIQKSYGLGAARLALALSARSPFADVELLDPMFFFTGSAKGAYERAQLRRVRLRKEAVASISTGVFVANAPGAESGVYALDVTSEGFAASFRGQCASACQTAFGTLHLTAAVDDGGGKAILHAMAPWERPDTIALSGELNWSRRRASLDNAAISFGDHAAKGSLALDMTGVRPRLEGTIAYDTLDVTPVLTAETRTSPSEIRRPVALPFASGDVDRPVDFDLRVSAERFRGGSLDTGPLALALTATRDRLSVDIASVALFGGRASGRLDVNREEPDVLLLRGSGSRLDASALASAAQLPLGFSGPITLQAALTLPLHQPAEDMGAAAGTFTIRFPLGGSIEGEVARTLSAALTEQDLSWVFRGSSFPFTVGSIDGTVRPGGIDLKVEGQSGEKGIGGSLRVDFPGAVVSGTLLASENAHPPGAPQLKTAPEQAASSTKLIFSGTADALILTSSGKPSLSN